MQQLTSQTTMGVRPKSKKELAQEYDIHTGTIARWCQKLGIHTHGRLTVHQVLAFYQHYGLPGQYEMKIQLS
ncbi:hypothetical protein [Hymenobacter pini]|uniref:hypothetical protein n=1 Tax=Hymenobacter pini TaxID=2880879 RepID=UPI001CF2535E|nr:hypothetical protein [Hymenobacter pini]MCA8830488.1 hypothetical protein [Hymenobacter pini]